MLQLPAKFQINMLHCLENIKKTNSTNGHCSHTCNMSDKLGKLGLKGRFRLSCGCFFKIGSGRQKDSMRESCHMMTDVAYATKSSKRPSSLCCNARLQERFGCSFRTQAVLQYGLLLCHRQFADGGIEFEEERLTNPEEERYLFINLHYVAHLVRKRKENFPKRVHECPCTSQTYTCWQRDGNLSKWHSYRPLILSVCL
jgi:hypothetical protein